MAEYLDKTGLTYLWSKIKAKFDAKADKTTADALGKRIDNLILSSGTESSAEVVDARTGYDGTAHDTLGTAIRKQVSELKSDLSNITTIGKNLYNPNDNNIRESVYVGYNSGTVISNALYSAILIPIDSTKQTLSINKTYIQIAFFNVVPNLLDALLDHIIDGYINGFAGGATSSENISIPSNAVSAIVSCANSNLESLQIEYGNQCTSYEPYSGKLIDGKKIKEKSIPLSAIDSVTYDFVIDKNGNGDFTTFKSCFDHIQDNYDDAVSKFNIKVLSGEYDIRAEFTDTEWDTSGFVGLKVPKNCNIFHIGRKEDCVLRCVSENGKEFVSLLNIVDNVSISNITFYGENLRYVIHDDYSDIEYAINNVSYRRMENVDFIGKNLVYKCVYGAGTQGNADWQFNQCRFITYDENSYSFSVHDSTIPRYTNDKFVFNECEMVGADAYSLRLCPAKGGGNELVILNNCMFLGIEVSSQYTGDSEATTVFDIRGGGNTKGYRTKYYNSHDELSFPRFSDEVTLRKASVGGTVNISKGDYVKNRLTYITIEKADSSDGALGIALEDINIGEIGYIKLI